MQYQHEDYADGCSDVGEAARGAPDWISYYSAQTQHGPSSQYPDPGNMGDWYPAQPGSTEASTETMTAAPTYLAHHTPASQNTLREADVTQSTYYSQLGTDGQSPALEGTAAGTTHHSIVTPLQQDVPCQADSSLTLTASSVLPCASSTSAATSFAYSHGGYVGGQHPGNTRSDGQPISSGRPRRPSTLHPHQAHGDYYDDDYHHDAHLPAPPYLQVPGHAHPIAPAPTSPCLSSVPSPTPSSTTRQTPVTRKQCKWEGCASSNWFTTDSGLLRHVRSIHISPTAYSCPEPECTQAFGRHDHLLTHQRKMHGYSVPYKC